MEREREGREKAVTGENEIQGKERKGRERTVRGKGRMGGR